MTSEGYSLSLILPCHNEAVAIDHVIPKLLSVRELMLSSGLIGNFEIIVVDDESTDDSRELIARYPAVRLLQNSSRLGYGGSLKAGFSIARGDLIGFLDMDDTYQPQDLLDLVSSLHREGADIVFGERISRGVGMPWVRRLGNAVYTKLLKLCFACALRDVCTGFRVFRRARLAGVLELPESGLNFSLSLTLYFLTHGFKCSEVPIHYEERRGESKLAVVKDGLQFLWTVLHRRWASF